MLVTVVSDVLVKGVDPSHPLYEHYIYAPNSVRRDVVQDFALPLRPIHDKDRKNLEHRIGHPKFSVSPAQV